MELMLPKYLIKTFGCQMNYSDSERIAAFLDFFGLKEVKEKKTVQFSTSNYLKSSKAKNLIIIFNTCGVRQMAEDRVYGQVHNLRKNNPQIKIILTGCLALRADVQKRLKEKVDLFFPINQLQQLEKWLIKNYPEIENLNLKNSVFKNQTLSQENISYLSIKPKYFNKFSAYVPIMTGCNNFCSYCVVPYARGREISRPATEILKEIKDLIRKKYQHIILLGQNVNSYTDGKNNFSALLKKINALPGNFWLSFLSNHPKNVTDEMIETVAKSEKVCEFFHLPIQSGNDEILRKMNRHYTAQQYLNLINKIKKAYKKYKPDKLFSLTGDIIVGFPGETKKQFLDSAKIMRQVKYDMVYFGQFSPRPGTVAWKMKDNVSKKEKKQREKFLNEILKETSLKNNQKYVGKILEVLLEKKEGNFYFGKTRTMKNVKVIATNKKNLIGKIILVKITRAHIWNLEGKIVSKTNNIHRQPNEKKE